MFAFCFCSCCSSMSPKNEFLSMCLSCKANGCTCGWGAAAMMIDASSGFNPLADPAGPHWDERVHFGTSGQNFWTRSSCASVDRADHATSSCTHMILMGT